MFSMKSPTSTSFPIGGLLTIFAYLSPLSIYLHVFGSAAKIAPLSGETVFNRKLDHDFLFEVC
jgi:hypothetical protein